MPPEIILNSSQKKTLERIQQVPTLANIMWSDVENLLRTFVDQLGGLVELGSGTIVKVKLPNAKPSIFHRPHTKECDKGTIRALRRYLIQADIINDSNCAE